MSGMSAYDMVNQVFIAKEIPMSAAEVHGMMCGAICAGSQADMGIWIDSLIGKHYSKDVAEEDRDVLLKIYEAACTSIQGNEMNFELLLPDDDSELAIRAEALSHWCQGFVISFQCRNEMIIDDYSVDLEEAIQHILDISQLDYDHMSMTEEDEKAFIEVMEYVRIAVLMIFTEVTAQTKEGLSGVTSNFLH